MILVIANDKDKFWLPECWDELTGKQLIAIASLLFKNEISVSERGYIAYILCGFGNQYFSIGNSLADDGYNYFANEIIDKIMPLTDWLYNDITLTKQVLPTIEVPERFKFFGTTTLYGPSDNFNNLTVAEFADCEYCLREWADTQDEKWFHRFIGILYRPRKSKSELNSINFNGDERQVYNIHLNELMAAMTQRVADVTKAAILLWYRGCRSDLIANNKFLFSNGGKSKPDNGTWADVIHALAGPKFGTMDETARVYLKVIMKELKLMHEKATEYA